MSGTSYNYSTLPLLQLAQPKLHESGKQFLQQNTCYNIYLFVSNNIETVDYDTMFMFN